MPTPLSRTKNSYSSSRARCPTETSGGAVLRTELQGIAQQVQEDLVEGELVPQHGGQGTADPDPRLLLLRQAGQIVHHPRHQVVDVNGGEAQGLVVAARQGQQRVDQLPHGVRAVADAPQVVVAPRVEARRTCARGSWRTPGW